jgi:hypothetical protein
VHGESALKKSNSFGMDLTAGEEGEHGGGERDGVWIPWGGIGDLVGAGVAGAVVGGSGVGGGRRGAAPGETGREGDDGEVAEGEGPDFVADLGGEAEEGRGVRCCHVGLLEMAVLVV